MINNSINMIDGIYCSFNYVNNNIVIGQPIGGYRTLTDKYLNTTVSYLLRSNTQWEIGIGNINKNGSDIVIDRVKVVSSSNNDNPVEFANLSDPTLCVIPNQYNFNTGFNNLVIKNTDFTVDNIKTTYYVDATNNDVIAKLPESINNQGLIIEFKLLSSNNLLIIRSTESESIDGSPTVLLSGNKKYTRLISTGQGWTELLNSPSSKTNSEYLPLSINGSGVPGGSNYSLQYNAISGFDGLPSYYISPNLLIGGSGIGTAISILPVSGQGDTIFNNIKGTGNFIVNGISGRNLTFDSAGRLGINMPSGVRPVAALHINNNNCLDGIRLDNRNSCNPASLTLYHRPTTIPASGSTAALINLSAKNSVSNQINYVQLRSKILNSTVGSTSGEFIISVDNAGQLVDIVSVNKDRFTVSIGSSSFNITSSGTTISGPISISSLDIDGGIIAFTGLSSDNSPTTPTPTPTISLTPTITPTITLTSTPTPTPTPSSTPGL